MTDEINYDQMTDEAVVEIADPPAVIESMPVVAVSQLPTNWQDLSDSQKIDILHHKVDSIASQVAWIGQTFQGVINMVGNVGPMDLFKMMRGGK